MLFARQASGTALADTRTASQAELAKNGGPETFSLILKPTPDIGRRFGLVRFHDVYVLHYTCTCQEKNNEESLRTPALTWYFAFRDRN
jgi:hypothetical protein